ncbi:unnamed protein product, partial [Prorocentrum cordatum]
MPSAPFAHLSGLRWIRRPNAHLSRSARHVQMAGGQRVFSKCSGHPAEAQSTPEDHPEHCFSDAGHDEEGCRDERDGVRARRSLAGDNGKTVEAQKGQDRAEQLWVNGFPAYEQHPTFLCRGGRNAAHGLEGGLCQAPSRRMAGVLPGSLPHARPRGTREDEQPRGEEGVKARRAARSPLCPPGIRRERNTQTQLIVESQENMGIGREDKKP